MGRNIKLARKRKKLTTVQVSERAGIARSTLYLIEKGNRKIKGGLTSNGQPFLFLLFLHLVFYPVFPPLVL